MSEKAKRKGIVQLPDKDKSRCLEAVCYGNSRIGSLLDYFIYGANLEAERQHLEEGCNVVTVTRKHKDILGKLNFNLSRKTLIRYLDLLNEWGYVSSATYARDFTVNGDKIQEAIVSPPQKPDRSPRERKPAPIKGCKVVDDNLLKVIEELQEKVVTLQLKVVDLQQKVVTLQLKVDILSTLQPALKPLAESDEGHNFDPYSNNSNNKNITVINIPANQPATPTIVAEATTHTLFVSDLSTEQTQVLIDKEATGKPHRRRKVSLTDTTHIPLPAKPSEDEAWIPLTCMRLADYYRQSILTESNRKDSDYQKAVKSAIILVNQQHKTYQEVDMVFRFMLCLDKDGGIYDEWWEGKRVDLWHVEKYCTEKIKEIECKKKQGRMKATSPQAQPETTVRVSNDASKRNFDRMAAAVAAKGVVIQ